MSSPTVGRSALSAGSTLVGAGCMVVGLCVGLFLAKPERVAATPEHAVQCPPVVPTPQPPVVVGAVATRLSDEDKAALRGIVHEELTALRGAPDTSPAAPDPSAAVLSGENMKAYDRAHAAITDALARGSWTEEDRTELRRNLASLPAERRVELIRPLVVAVNEQRVHYAGHGPPM